jgi:hypothetical protein
MPLLGNPMRTLIIGMALLGLSFATSLAAGISVLHAGPAEEYVVRASRGYSLHPLPPVRGTYVVVGVPEGIEAYLPDQVALERWLSSGAPFDSSVPRENSIAYVPSVARLVIFNPGNEGEITVRIAGVEVEKPYLLLGIPGAILGLVGAGFVIPSATLILLGRRARAGG